MISLETLHTCSIYLVYFIPRPSHALSKQSTVLDEEIIWIRKTYLTY